MKRPRPDPAALEAARRAAEEARVRAGLEAVPPEELEHERLQAERRARRKRAKGKLADPSKYPLLRQLVGELEAGGFTFEEACDMLAATPEARELLRGERQNGMQ
jgi:hypothetical protein